MFFTLSKIFWFVAAPTNLFMLCAALGVGLLYLDRFRAGRLLAAVGIGMLLLAAGSPLPRALVRPLEDRFPQVIDIKTPIHGIVVLGGAIGRTRNATDFNDGAERMTESARLASLHPTARLVFAGGSVNLLSDVTWTEAGEAGRFYRQMGISEDRMTLEDTSRNTFENARNVARLIAPKPGERWLLVTSAYHMPRSFGVFRKAGLDLEPYPVDYSTQGGSSDFLRPQTRFSNGLMLMDNTVKEWIGLIVYRALGYTDALFPAPRPAPIP
jgi:uncharacterized SAM-binding protein YcdF (DUF218 family)